MNAAIRTLLKKIVYSIGSLLRILFEKISGKDYRSNTVDISFKKILIVDLHKIGDVLFTTPCVRALREEYPDAHIAVWVKSRSYDVVRDNPDFDEIIIFDDVCTDRTREKFWRWLAKLRFTQRLRRENFDLIVDLSGVFDSIFIGILSGAKYRIGFSSQGLGFLFNKEVRIHHGGHLVKKYNSVVEGLGIKVSDEHLHFKLSEVEKDTVCRIRENYKINTSNRMVCIHPGAGWFSKCWPVEYFAKLIDDLERRYKVNGVKTFICGGKSDSPQIKKIVEMTKYKPVVLAGGFTLRQTAAFINQCDVFVGHDSGPTYLAEALRIPIVVLFGPTNPAYSAPRSKNCIVIHKKLPCSPKNDMQHCHNIAAYPCKTRECMREISVNEVFNAVNKLLSLNNEKN